MKVPTCRQELQRQRAALDALTGEIGALKSDIGRAVYEIGTRLKRVHGEALWQVGDYSGFEDYLARGVAISRSTAYLPPADDLAGDCSPHGAASLPSEDA